MATAIQKKSLPEASIPAIEPSRPAVTPVPPSIAKPHPAAARSSAPWGLLFSVVFLAAIGGAGYHYWPQIKPFLYPDRGAGGPPAERVIPVVTAVAKPGNMELSLNSLGTVAGFNTVIIRSRVEGELIRVAFTEGQMVDEGDLLAEIDPRPFEVQLKEAEAQKAKDEAAVRVAASDYDRYKTLANTKSITQQELGAQRALLQQNQATVDADASRIDSIKLQLKYCRITSPLKGRIGLRTVDKGNIVRANDPNGLAVVTQLQPISVVFSIPQDEIPRVQKKMRALKELGEELKVDAFARDFQTKIASGTLSAIDNQVDAATGTVRLKAKFPNEDYALFPNQFVNARMEVETIADTVLVPSAAVQRGPDFSYVYVVKADSRVELRIVTAGPTEGDQASVMTGLKPDEVVVIDGVDKLRDKSKVSTLDKNRGDKNKGDKNKGDKNKGDKKGSDDKGSGDKGPDTQGADTKGPEAGQPPTRSSGDEGRPARVPTEARSDRRADRSAKGGG